MNAIFLYGKAVKILPTVFSSNRTSLACYNNNIDQMYQRMRKYSTILSSYEKSIGKLRTIYSFESQ
jgi:hypothetical protein